MVVFAVTTQCPFNELIGIFSNEENALDKILDMIVEFDFDDLYEEYCETVGRDKNDATIDGLDVINWAAKMIKESPDYFSDYGYHIEDIEIDNFNLK